MAGIDHVIGTQKGNQILIGGRRVIEWQPTLVRLRSCHNAVVGRAGDMQTRQGDVAVGDVERNLAKRDRLAHRDDGFHAGFGEGNLPRQHLAGDTQHRLSPKIVARHADSGEIAFLRQTGFFPLHRIKLMDDKKNVQGAIADVLRRVKRSLQLFSRSQALPGFLIAPLMLHMDRHIAATGPMAAEISAVVPRLSQASGKYDNGKRL